jgi:formylglycine-generating enzyme required for sulfatase activity
MHHETLLYMWHQLPYEVKRQPAGYRPVIGGDPPPPFRIEIPAGCARLGAERDELEFGWDNEFGAQAIEVAAFGIDAYNVTNKDYLAFVEQGAAPSTFWVRRDGAWYWRGMFEEIPLPPAWPVYVTKDEAAAYAEWRGGRLMTEAEFHRAAYGGADGGESSQPWGDGPADATRGNFDWQSFDPVPVGSYPQGSSAFGVHDLVGNGWEWTGSPFGPLPGFEPMAAYPEYSAEFFDGQHFVMKGASPATARELVRRTFRNWFRPNYPYVYGTFRVVYDSGRSHASESGRS